MFSATLTSKASLENRAQYPRTCIIEQQGFLSKAFTRIIMSWAIHTAACAPKTINSCFSLPTHGVHLEVIYCNFGRQKLRKV